MGVVRIARWPGATNIMGMRTHPLVSYAAAALAVAACSHAPPADYAPDPTIVGMATADADSAGTKVVVTTSIDEAVRDADVVETDVWASMGQEEEAEKRRRDFAGWQVDRRVMSLAKKDAIFMHCLPAHRGEEVSADVIDSPRSVIFDEAENRLHVQKAIMVALMGK